MSDTLVRWSATERYRPVAPLSRTALIPLLALGGLALTTGMAVAAAAAGVTQQVSLPHWLGPWRVRQPGTKMGWVVLGLVTLGALCVLWTWLVAALLRRLAARAEHGADDTGRWRWPSLRPRTVAGIGALWAVPFLIGGPMVSLDVQSYAAIGRLATLGLDPYQDTPGLLADRFGAGVDPLWRWTPTPYGPLQVQLLHGLVRLAGDHVGPAVLLIRAVAVLGGLGALLLTMRATLPRERTLVLAMTVLNPVLLIHVVSGAHLDVLIGAAALLVIGLTRRGHPAAAMTLAVAACAFKLPSSVLIAFVVLDLLRRTSGAERHRALLQTGASALATMAAIVVLCPDPFGWVPALNIPGIVRNGTAPSTWASYFAAVMTGHTSGAGLVFSFTMGRTAMGMLGVGVIVILLWRATSGTTRQAMHGVGWALVALALTGPSVYPWYLTWGLFAAAVGSGPRGRLALVALSSATCVAAALAPGGVEFVAWAGILGVVLWFTVRVGRQFLPRRVGTAQGADLLSMGAPGVRQWSVGPARDDVPAR